MDISEALLSAFPRLAGQSFEVTSRATSRYNCIAWAVTVTHVAWWPGLFRETDLENYWPPNCPREESLGAFECAFSTKGYQRCDSGELETGLEKIALYAKDGTPTHAARQLPSGLWSSKLGGDVDITHDLSGLCGVEYGDVIAYFSRSR
jgi:hypothetical protein